MNKLTGAQSHGAAPTAVTVLVITLVLITVTSCATDRLRSMRRSGIRGKVIPVDESGDEIRMQDKDEIIITALPVKNTGPDVDNATTANAKNDGSFSIDLREGRYVVEIFLEGFYVFSRELVLEGKRKDNLGAIEITRIQSETGIPIRGDDREEPVGSGGDVNIQPPVN
jgi:hypothetical protein